ncbi:hypothetical protein NUSPORA_01686 [Nucleospora cyclopteri]
MQQINGVYKKCLIFIMLLLILSILGYCIFFCIKKNNEQKIDIKNGKPNPNNKFSVSKNTNRKRSDNSGFGNIEEIKNPEEDEPFNLNHPNFNHKGHYTAKDIHSEFDNYNTATPCVSNKPKLYSVDDEFTTNDYYVPINNYRTPTRSSNWRSVEPSTPYNLRPRKTTHSTPGIPVPKNGYNLRSRQVVNPPPTILKKRKYSNMRSLTDPPN